jgi:hypothetical protein
VRGARAVEIPKQGGIRVLGIPNVVDRVAQKAAAMALEPSVEPVFHEDSYGYRPGRAPVDAVAVCRERCFRKDWVVDLDFHEPHVPVGSCGDAVRSGAREWCVVGLDGGAYERADLARERFGEPDVPVRPGRDPTQAGRAGDW